MCITPEDQVRSPARYLFSLERAGRGYQRVLCPVTSSTGSLIG